MNRSLRIGVVIPSHLVLDHVSVSHRLDAIAVEDDAIVRLQLFFKKKTSSSFHRFKNYLSELESLLLPNPTKSRKRFAQLSS